MSTQDTAQAAAALTRDILSDLAANQGNQNAAAMLAEMDGPGQPDEAPPAPPVVSSPPPAAEAAEQVITFAPGENLNLQPEGAAEPELDEGPTEMVVTEPALPSYDPLPDDELDRLLAEPDFDEEAAAEVTSEFESGDVDFDDPAAEAKLRALQKKNEWLEKQLVQRSQKNWAQENLRKYPLLATYAADDVAAIQANSRRAFAREAARLNDRLTTMLKPALDDIAAAKAALKAEATSEARAEVAAAWGKPAVDPAAGAPGRAEVEAELQAAREARASTVERFKILMRGGK